MEAVETIYATPTTRVSVFYDSDCQNPLENWDHGIQFATLPNDSRTNRDYTELDGFTNTHGNGRSLDLDALDNFREFWDDSWREPYQHQHNAPKLSTYLDTHAAAWGTLQRSGYDGTLMFTPGADGLESDDAIVCISRSMWREMQGLPADKPMPKGFRQAAMDCIKAVIDEYNKWATGDCYGYQVQEHNSACPYCEDRDEPDTDCDCWDDTDDACWGFIGHEYIMQEANELASMYQSINARTAAARELYRLTGKRG